MRKSKNKVGGGTTLTATKKSNAVKKSVKKIKTSNKKTSRKLSPSSPKAKSPSPPPPAQKYRTDRDVIILPVPSSMKWFTPNMAYRRSTGTSNEFCENRISTNNFWVPTFGLVTEKHLESWRNLVKLDPPIPVGYITKIESIFSTKFSHLTHFISNTINGYEKQSKFSKNLIDKYFQFTYLRELNIKSNGLITCLLQYVFPRYFMNWEQLQISAFLGGEFWNQVEEFKEFREFILNHTINVESKSVWKIEKLSEPFSISIVEGSKNLDESEINDYMETHASLPEFMKEDYNDTYNAKNILDKLYDKN